MPEEKKRDVSHEVQPDEDLPIIAADYGIKDWKFIYDHPKNEELRKKRPDPHILYKGDKVWIPEVEPEKFEAETNKKNRYTLYHPKTVFHLVLENDEGEPYGNVKYEIWINNEKYNPSGREEELRTRKDGLIHHMVPVAREIELRVWWEDEDKDEDEDTEGEGEEYDTLLFHPGHLDPIDTVDGLQDRLISLNYDCGDDPEGELGEGTRAALRRFQKDYGLVPTGEIDDLTRRLLAKRHGA